MIIHKKIPIIPQTPIINRASLILLKWDRRSKGNKKGFIYHIIVKAFYIPPGIIKYKIKQNN